MKYYPPSCQRIFEAVTSRLDEREVHFDEILPYSDTWNEYLNFIKRFFDRLSDTNLKINLKKNEFCHDCATFLGHAVGQGQYRL